MRPRGNGFLICLFPGGTYLPSFRNGVLMMSSDFASFFLGLSCRVSLHRRRCLAYAGGFADRAASLLSLPSDL